jgi:two-component system, NtrC family, sensor kinase
MDIELKKLLFEINKSPVIDGGDLTIASDLIVDAITTGLTLCRAGIWLLSEDKQQLKSYLLRDKKETITNVSLPRSAFPVFFNALDKKRNLVIHREEDDYINSEFLDAYLIPNDITTLIASPIHHHGEMVGVLIAEQKTLIKPWDLDDEDFVCALADVVGRVIGAKQTLTYQQKLLQINTELEVQVSERTQALNEALNNLHVTQSTLLESEKMAALGSLVAGVAHEVNTPLGIAVTSVSHCIDELNLLKKRFSSNELDEEDFVAFIDTLSDGLQLIDRNLSRAAELVHNFKRTAADQLNLEKERFNLSHYLEQISSPLRPLTRKHNIRLDINIIEDIFVESYPGAIAQIFTNLVSNCFRHAYPDNFIGDKQIVLGAERCGDEIKMYYKDNGKGLTPEVKEKIFEPFFTTARNDGGTGLGMSIVFNLVNKTLGGRLILISDMDQGLELDIFIKATE